MLETPEEGPTDYVRGVMLRFDDAWVWDSWVVDDGTAYHLFYLTAPKQLGHPALRHTHATVGHAISSDLVTWRSGPATFQPSTDGWDDLAIWTGSVAREPGGPWRLFYTALSSRGHGVRDQRIGLAESEDLATWRRVGSDPIAEVDARWYRTLDEDATASETWRDPFVFQAPGASGWHMLITARIKDGTPGDDGVIGHAISDDMKTWTVFEPLSDPAGFGQIEVPQIRQIEGEWILVFTCHPDEQSAERVSEWGRWSTWSVRCPSPLGPLDLNAARPFTAERALFAAPLVQKRDGQWALLGFRNLESEGDFTLEILDPITVAVAPDGGLVAARTPQRVSNDAR